MIVIGNFVRDVRELGLKARLSPVYKALTELAQFASIRQRAVFEYPFAGLECEIEARETRVSILELVDDS